MSETTKPFPLILLEPSTPWLELPLAGIMPPVGPISCWTPVASFTKEVNPGLAKRPLVYNGRLANRGLTSLVKEATSALKPFSFNNAWNVWIFL